MNPWAAIIARKLQVPVIRFSPTYAMNEHTRGMFDFGQRFREMLADRRDDLRRLCEEYDVPAMDLKDVFLRAAPLNLVFLPRAFQPQAETFDERFVFVGPSILPRPGTASFPFDKFDGRPLAYMSLGTIFNDRPDLFNSCFAAFKDRPWQVVLAYGERTDPAALDAAPENFLIAPPVPQLEILARTQVFITHGGMNSTMESIYYGVPMVVIPQMPEQAATARRVQELGLGVALEPGEIGPDVLRDAVTRVAEDSAFRERVREMRQLAHEAGGERRRRSSGSVGEKC